MVKRSRIIVFLGSVLVIASLLVRYISFSPTDVRLTDENGAPIVDASIQINYLCSRYVFDLGGGTHDRSLFMRKGQTDADGRYTFLRVDRHVIFNVPAHYNCRKYVTAYKEGYCDTRSHSDRTPPISEPQKKPCWIDYGGTGASIPTGTTNIFLQLKKVQGYSGDDNPCVFHREYCRVHPEVQEAVRAKNINKCSYKDNLCITEVAYALRQPSLCSSLEPFMRMGCQMNLASKLLDPSICERAIMSDKQYAGCMAEARGER